ncbi:hypothetical protein, partial [Solibacillus isronensis]
MHSATANIAPGLADAFHRTLSDIVEHIDEHVIADFRVIKTNWYHRQQLIHKFKRKPVQFTHVSVNALEKDKQMIRLRYYFSGKLPREEYRARGYIIEPVHAKVQTYRLFGHEMMCERIVWLPATGTISLALNGHRIPLSP